MSPADGRRAELYLASRAGPYAATGTPEVFLDNILEVVYAEK